MSGPDDGLSPLAKSYRAAAPWLAIVWQFTGSVLVGVGMGYGLDWWVGTKPWGLLAGGLLGSGVGFYAFVRSATKLMEKK